MSTRCLIKENKVHTGSQQKQEIKISFGNKSEREAPRPANAAEQLGDLLQLGENQQALWHPPICDSY